MNLLYWGAAIIVFLVVEGVTLGLASIWFALGALAALISAAFGAQLWLQVTLFIVISAATLLLTRPLVVKYVNSKRQPTNADRVIGMFGVVTEEINNLTAKGSVMVDGKYWTARSHSGENIKTGDTVKIMCIKGVKLFVVKAEVQSKIEEDQTCQQH